jgi:hypothetical protein
MMAMPQAMDTNKTVISTKRFSKKCPIMGAARTKNGAMMQCRTQAKEANVIIRFFVDSVIAFPFIALFLKRLNSDFINFKL